jgi:hypothetical protein
MALPKLIGRFKMLSAKRINKLRQTPGLKLWQRNYWEHMVRNEPELNRFWEYIRNNAARWESDKLFVQGQAHRSTPAEIHEPVTEYEAQTWMV